MQASTGRRYASPGGEVGEGGGTPHPRALWSVRGPYHRQMAIFEDVKDEVLLEYGRVIWEIVRLEEAATGVAEHVLTGLRGRTPAVTYFHRAADALKECGENEHVLSAIGWFDDVEEMMSIRNSIVHGFPQWPYPGDKGPSELVHWPNRGGDPIRTALDPVALREIAARVIEVSEAFEDAWDAVDALREAGCLK